VQPIDSEWLVEDEDWEEPEPAARQVLIVDDDPSVLAMLGYLFDDEGFTVREAADGAEALVMLREEPPTCMVLDLMMPNVDGLSVLESRRQEGIAPDTRIVVLTAKTDTSDRVWCWELGADEYVNKPVDPEVLLREVELLLKRTPDEIRARREEGLAEAHRLDALEAAFDPKRKH
jgi:DNA-binding response OmpR family regulator